MYAVYFDQAAVPAIVQATRPAPARDSLPWVVVNLATGQVVEQFAPRSQSARILPFRAPARSGFSPLGRLIAA